MIKTEKKIKTIIITTNLAFVSMIEVKTMQDYEDYLPQNVKTFECSDKNTDYRFLVDEDLLEGKNKDTFISTLLYKAYQYNSQVKKSEPETSYISAC